MQSVVSFILLLGLLQFPDPQEKPFILVELFTSEGCSSCPPADRLLSEIVDGAYENTNVLGLSFHVDYWDYIGWKDPYAKKEFTERQRAYARKFQSEQIYTPQMVVNGKHGFVGSDKARWKSLLKKLKEKPPKYSFNIESLQVGDNEVKVEVTSPLKDKVILNAVVVERDLSQRVTRGENRGRTLRHDNVVRSFKSRQFDGKANVLSLDIPKDLRPENASLVLYAQNENNWDVVGVKAISLTEEISN